MDYIRVPRIFIEQHDRFCYDDCLATILNSFGKDYQLFYSEFLKNGITKKLDIFFEECLNIEYIRIEEVPKDIFEIVLTSIRKGYIILVSIDGYYCPWDWRYLELNNSIHNFLLTDWDEGKERFVCMDPYYEKNSILLSKKNFLKGCREIELFKKINDKQRYSIIKETCNLIKSGNLNRNIDKLLERIANLKKYIHDSMLDEVIQLLEDIIDSRVRFFSLLNYIKSKMDRELKLDNYFELLSGWKKIYVFIIKYRFKNDKENYIDKIEFLLHDVIGHEKLEIENVLLQLNDTGEEA